MNLLLGPLRTWALTWNTEQMIELTPEELAKFDGTDPSKPIYLAILCVIFRSNCGVGLVRLIYTVFLCRDTFFRHLLGLSSSSHIVHTFFTSEARYLMSLKAPVSMPNPMADMPSSPASMPPVLMQLVALRLT